MDKLNTLITKELIEQKLNELLEKNLELKEKYPRLQNVSLNNGAEQLQPQQELPDCSAVPCPINDATFSVCCFTTHENIFPTNFDPIFNRIFTFDVTFDPTNIECVAEPFCVADVGPIGTSCGPVNGSCQVEVFAIRATGKLPYVTSYPVSNELVCPNNPSFSNICCDGFACLDNIVCLSCDPETCPDFCDIFSFAFAFPVVSDPCGSMVWASITIFFLPTC